MKKVIYIRLGSLLMLVILSICIIISINKIYKWDIDNKKNKLVKNEIQNTAIIYKTEKSEISSDISNDEDDYEINFANLKETNKDVVGWLDVPNTNIKYPVVKAKDNSYYLTHNFSGEYNYGGWIFADYRNNCDGSDKNLVIYGHNVRDNSMFGSLKNILEEKWYNDENNYNITFMTENKNDIYRVFSIYKIEAEDYYIQTKFKDNNAFEEFANKIKERSIKNFDVQVGAEDSILTLSTCANNNKYRVVLHAKKMQ